MGLFTQRAPGIGCPPGGQRGEHIKIPLPRIRGVVSVEFGDQRKIILPPPGICCGVGGVFIAIVLTAPDPETQARKVRFLTLLLAHLHLLRVPAPLGEKRVGRLFRQHTGRF